MWGHGVFDIQFGPVMLTHMIAVAEIEDEFLFVDDLLWCDEEGPMDILNSEHVLHVLT